jgi:hypothetical protein
MDQKIHEGEAIRRQVAPMTPTKGTADPRARPFAHARSRSAVTTMARREQKLVHPGSAFDLRDPVGQRTDRLAAIAHHRRTAAFVAPRVGLQIKSP